MTTISFCRGMRFTNTRSGRTVVVLDVKPGGRLDMGQMMEGPVPDGLSGIHRQWNTTTHSVRSLISDGSYVCAGHK